MALEVNMEKKVTIEQVRAFIVEKEFMRLGKKTCVCMATLANGYEIVASSACVDPATYDAKIGEALCTARIEDKVWELLGFELQSELYSKENFR